MTRRNLLDEIQIIGGNVKLPAISQQDATEFGKRLYEIRVYETAVQAIDEKIKQYERGIFDYFQTAEEIYDRFKMLSEGESELSIEEFRAQFPENFKLPSFEDLCRSYEEIKSLRRVQAQYKKLNADALQAASELDFQIVYGKTWRSNFDSVVAESKKIEADPTRFNRSEIAKAIDGTPTGFRVLKDDETVWSSDLVWSVEKQDYVYPRNHERARLAGDLAGAYVQAIRATKRETTPHQAAIETDAAKVEHFPPDYYSSSQQNEAFNAIPPDFYLLSGDQKVELSDFVWTPSKMYCSPDPASIGTRAEKFVAAIRKRDGVPSTPVGYVLKRVGKVESANMILRSLISQWEHPFDYEVGGAVGVHFAVAEPIPVSEESDGVDFAALRQTALDSIPEGFAVRTGVEKVQGFDKVFDLASESFVSPQTWHIGKQVDQFVAVVKPTETAFRKSDDPDFSRNRAAAMSQMPDGWTVRELSDKVGVGDKIFFPTIQGGSFVDVEDHQVGLPVHYYVAVIEPLTTLKPSEGGSFPAPATPPEYFQLHDGAYVAEDDLVLDTLDAQFWRAPEPAEIGNRAKYFAKVARRLVKQ